jgi:predicted Zn-dependent protease
MSKIILICVVLLVSAMGCFSSEFADKFPLIVKKIDEIKEKEKGNVKGKLTEIIKEVAALKYDEKDEDEPMAYLTTLGELCTINGDYVKSNEYYEKIVALVPHASFYRLMVINMLLKGDKDAANKIVETFNKKAEEIKDVEDRKRQIAHVKSAFDEVKIPAKEEAK